VVEVSDNTAANALLKLVGGPAGLTNYLRGLGDPTTRLDRIELALNSNLPGDPRDTTTPNAMAATMGKILVGDALSPAARARLTGWMKNCRTGLSRLRAGLPPDWVVGDKTGTGENGAVVDDAVASPPKRAPILIASYLSGSQGSIEALEAAHAMIGGIVAAAFG
jgi:beta-lactamase class A